MSKRCANISGWVVSVIFVLAVVETGAQGVPGGGGSGGNEGAGTSRGNGGGASATGMVPGPAGGFQVKGLTELTDRIFDPASDSMNFEEGTFVWKGRRFELTGHRAFRSRFERFLLSSPDKETGKYAELMKRIRERLSVANRGTDDSLPETWDLLFRAGRFDADGGNSVIVANHVFNAWRLRRERRESSMDKKELEELREYQEEVVANRERALQRLRENRRRETALRNNDGEKPEPSEEMKELTSESIFRAKDLAETEARIAALETESAATGTQAKLQFQSQIVTFLLQRRFQHALILSGFYQKLFKGSAQKLEVGDEQLRNFLPEADLSFTVDTMAFVAREAMNDVGEGVEAVEAAYREGRRMVALERLQEVFFLGEYLPELNRIPKEWRRNLLDLYRGMLEAKKLAEEKDYEGLAEKAEELGELAGDFPKRRVLSAVETAKSMSDMAVFAASQYRNLGDVEKARRELARAVEIWPGNPSVREFQKETTEMATAGSRGVRVFDDLYERGDYRAIYERRMELGFALSDDAERRPKFNEVVEKIARVDLLVSQSEELVRQGEAYAAWELLAEAKEMYPDDGPMNRARAELAPKVSDFVRLLDRAEEQEQADRSAAALASYLAAREIYPASRICRKGIARVSESLMDSLAEREERRKKEDV